MEAAALEPRDGGSVGGSPETSQAHVNSERHLGVVPNSHSSPNEAHPHKATLIQDVATQRDTPLKPETTWYGWQTLTSDAASIGLFIAAAVTAADANGRAYGGPIAGVAVAGYLLGGPIAHLAHESPPRALGSLLLRAGLPTVGAAAGLGFGYLAVQDCEGDSCFALPLVGAIFLSGAGILSAMVVDAAALAYETRPAPPAEVTFTPAVQVGKDTAGLLVNGTF